MPPPETWEESRERVTETEAWEWFCVDNSLNNDDIARSFPPGYWLAADGNLEGLRRLIERGFEVNARL
jgi:hypothetical protein